MVSDVFLRRCAQDRMARFHEEAARARLLPSFRARLALKVHALAGWLEPKLEVPAARSAPDFRKTLEGEL